MMKKLLTDLMSNYRNLSHEVTEKQEKSNIDKEKMHDEYLKEKKKIDNIFNGF